LTPGDSEPARCGAGNCSSSARARAGLLASQAVDLVRKATIVIGDEFFENADAVLEAGDILVKVGDNAAELGSLAFGLAAAGADLVALQLDALLDYTSDGADQHNRDDEFKEIEIEDP
jgi:hypothetical protein